VKEIAWKIVYASLAASTGGTSHNAFIKTFNSPVKYQVDAKVNAPCTATGPWSPDDIEIDDRSHQAHFSNASVAQAVVKLVPKLENSKFS